MNRWWHVEVHIEWSSIIDVVIVRPEHDAHYRNITQSSLRRLVDVVSPFTIAVSVDAGDGHWIYGGHNEA